MTGRGPGHPFAVLERTPLYVDEGGMLCMKNETILGIEISLRTVVVVAPCEGWRFDERSPG